MTASWNNLWGILRNEKPERVRVRPDVWGDLHLANMTWNLRQVRKRVKVPVMGVIKANAYGHGLRAVGRFLDRNGIDALMVGKLEEAIHLRDAGVRCPILNFGPLSLPDAEVLARYEIEQSVFTQEIERLSQKMERQNTILKVHIHVDTGMGRMGIPYHQALAYIKKAAGLKGLHIQGVSTTLTEDPEFDKIQMERFLTLCRQAKASGISIGFRHACSSAGVMSMPSSCLDMVRPGILLYGYYPNEDTQRQDELALRPVLHVKTRVAAVKTLRPGDSVSYHRAYTAQAAERIAVIPVGYSDGFPPSAVKGGAVLIRGRRFPLIGAVTANHSVVRVGSDPSVSVGDEVVLLGTQGNEKIFAPELGRWSGLSSYRILIGLNPSLQKIIRKGL
ncbi:MAG: alanine racemase [Candidatus Aminicenantales bacterium]